MIVFVFYSIPVAMCWLMWAILRFWLDAHWLLVNLSFGLASVVTAGAVFIAVVAEGFRK